MNMFRLIEEDIICVITRLQSSGPYVSASRLNDFTILRQDRVKMLIVLPRTR